MYKLETTLLFFTSHYKSTLITLYDVILMFSIMVDVCVLYNKPVTNAGICMQYMYNLDMSLSDTMLCNQTIVNYSVNCFGIF